jgi:hypothetical protein
MILFFAMLACKAPPPAPVGLNDASKYLLRNFYADDATIGAGLTGFLDWYDTEGAGLADQEATVDNVDGYQLAGLAPEDIAMLPFADDGRILENAHGVIALADMDCPWSEAEALLVRTDQHVVFEGDLLEYQRDFLTSRETYEGASASREFVGIDEAMPVLDAGFDPATLSSDILWTVNNDVSARNLGVTVTYDLVLNFRHGIYEVQGEDRVATLIVTSIPERAESTDNSTIAQSYSVEVDLDRDGRTFRMLAIWTELDSPIMDPDSPLILSSAVNQIRRSAEHMTAICQGEIEIPPEPTP